MKQLLFNLIILFSVCANAKYRQGINIPFSDKGCYLDFDGNKHCPSEAKIRCWFGNKNNYALTLNRYCSEEMSTKELNQCWFSNREYVFDVRESEHQNISQVYKQQLNRVLKSLILKSMIDRRLTPESLKNSTSDFVDKLICTIQSEVHR